MAIITVNDVSREFKVYKSQKGLLNTIKSLVARKYAVVKAVEHISFTVEKGELVGYIGPNGAGKSTTIKMLSGILVPTGGEIIVNGRIPYAERRHNALNIGVVFGQRSQLFWDLPMEETFELYKKMYRVDEKRFRENKAFYIELLEMQTFLRTPIRQLSLGQKMRANLAVALLHDPPIVYLDEPTIGLDVVAKDKIRKFLTSVNKEKQTTVILTTHDMDDIEQICQRLILIDKGRLLYDGALQDFKRKFSTSYSLTVEFHDNHREIRDSCLLNIVNDEGLRKTFLFDKADMKPADAITLITRNYDVLDIKLQEETIEDIVRNIYLSAN